MPQSIEELDNALPPAEIDIGETDSTQPPAELTPEPNFGGTDDLGIDVSGAGTTVQPIPGGQGALQQQQQTFDIAKNIILDLIAETNGFASLSARIDAVNTHTTANDLFNAVAGHTHTPGVGITNMLLYHENYDLGNCFRIVKQGDLDLYTEMTSQFAQNVVEFQNAYDSFIKKSWIALDKNVAEYEIFIAEERFDYFGATLSIATAIGDIMKGDILSGAKGANTLYSVARSLGNHFQDQNPENAIDNAQLENFESLFAKAKLIEGALAVHDIMQDIEDINSTTEYTLGDLVELNGEMIQHQDAHKLGEAFIAQTYVFSVAMETIAFTADFAVAKSEVMGKNAGVNYKTAKFLATLDLTPDSTPEQLNAFKQEIKDETGHDVSINDTRDAVAAAMASTYDEFYLHKTSDLFTWGNDVSARTTEYTAIDQIAGRSTPETEDDIFVELYGRFVDRGGMSGGFAEYPNDSVEGISLEHVQLHYGEKPYVNKTWYDEVFSDL